MTAMREPNGGGETGNVAARPGDHKPVEQRPVERTAPEPKPVEHKTEHKTGRYSMLYRDGARVEVGDPVQTSEGLADRQWLCAAKLIGPKKDRPPAYEDLDMEGTQTLLVRTGRGSTPEEAQRDALNQLALVYGTPNAPPPAVVITKKPSEPPPPMVPPPAAGFRGWLARVFGRRA